jgi:hypothetical protein
VGYAGDRAHSGARKLAYSGRNVAAMPDLGRSGHREAYRQSMARAWSRP